MGKACLGRPTALGLLCKISLTVVSVSPGAAHEPASWRFWTSADHMAESNGQALSVGLDGRIWVRHGAIRSMSILDGFAVSTVPEPRQAPAVNWDLLARVYPTHEGDAWTVEDKALKRFDHGIWRVVRSQAPGEHMVAAVPVGNGQLGLLYQDRLEILSVTSGGWTVIQRASKTQIGPFRAMVPGFWGELWLVGAHGLGRAEPLPNNLGYRWQERDCHKETLRDFRYPVPDQKGGLFAIGESGDTGDRVLVRWKNTHLETILKAKGSLRGWSGTDGVVWALQGGSLFRLESGHRFDEERSGLLSSQVVDVVTESNGAFWMTTGDTVARYASALWRSPSAVSAVHSPVHSIVEDASGRVWFSTPDELLSFDGSNWKTYPYPGDLHTDPLHTDNMTVTPNGDVVLRMSKPQNFLLELDSKTGKFAPVRHPQNLHIWLATRQRDGTLLLETGPPPWEGCRIERYDGRRFELVADLGAQWHGDIRMLLQAGDGSIWLGGTGGTGVYRNGIYHSVTPAEGYSEMGSLALAEIRGQILAGGRESLLSFAGGRWSALHSGFDRVRGIVQLAGGAVWVAAANGIHRYEKGSWIPNGEAEGLPSDAVLKIFEDSHGRVWAGTNRGLSLYHPDADREAPRVQLSAVQNPTEVSSQGNIRIVFAGTDKWQQTRSERLLYSYRLDGGKWSTFTAESAVSLQQLAAGRHHIEVRAMDRNGNISTTADSFPFLVAFPWYRQNEFLYLAAFGAAAILALLRLAANQYLALKRAKQTAEAASNAKSEFLANMSHELRTPMSGIMGLTALAREAAIDAEQREHLRMAEKCSESLLNLLNDILDMSKIEAGKLELVPVDFNLNECLDEVIQLFRRRADEKSIAIVVNRAADMPDYLFGDDLRLKQILINLIGNALKFTEKGEILLEVSRGAAKADSDEIHFKIGDTGIGVPAEKQAIIFDPFEQADKTTNRKYGGSGLGLAISSKLVRLMHGTLQVESPWRHPITGHLVNGSAFHFTARLGLGRPPQVTSAEPLKRTRALRVLLAEDNEVNRLVGTRMLEKLGHTVISARNGKEVIEVFARESVDLILMDVQMPIMDGFEATAEIRRSERGRNTRIIALTAHSLEGDRERCLNAGMDWYLTKPIRPAALTAALAKMAGTDDAAALMADQ